MACRLIPLLIFFCVGQSIAWAERAPNILLLIADDMTWRDCGPYGNDEVFTPNMNRLAEQGICFDGMFTSTAMCAPTRQQLYTGIWPVRNGAYANHSHVHQGVKSIVHHLKGLGYRVGLNGKAHFGPKDSFPFERVPGNGKEFIVRNPQQPYCLIIASDSPHRPWTEGPTERYDPEGLTVPPYLIDTETTRSQLAAYYAEITSLDAKLGQWIDWVDDSGQRDNTLLIFTSEQGSGFPFAKWTCYENGLKTAFIARWPAAIKPGTRTPAMCQYIDVVPTFIEMAGGDPTLADTGISSALDGDRNLDGRSFDGRSFLGVLLGRSEEHRKQVFGVHTTRGIIDGSKSYPVRSVRDARYKYIRNLNHSEAFTGLVLSDGGVYRAWREAAEADPKLRPRVRLIS
ncbi:MAG: sulfatase, partial [Pirellulales bacterium]